MSINRNEPLQIALTSWLLKKEITEIIIVDWSSDEALAPLSKLDKRIKVITVPNQKYFNQPQPLNLAASIATGDYILKVDCDYIFNPYYNFFETYQIDENSFVSGNHSMSKNYEYFNGVSYVIDKASMTIAEITEYLSAYNPIFRYLIGLLFVSRHNFIKVGGYNENLGKYYAYEDDEIFHRLRVLGLTEKKLTFNYNVLHLPHPDAKRTENFEGYDVQHLYSLLQNMEGETEDERKWNAEYALSLKHIEENKKNVPLTDNYYVNRITEWNLEQIDEQNYYAYQIMKKNNKLENFPSTYYVSLEESVDRQKNLERQFEEYNIIPTSIISKRYSESDDVVTGKYAHTLNDGTKGCVVSHLKAIKQWYENTDENYAFFCEDDLSLETIQYWNFTWEEFIESLPEDADCVQLLTIRSNFDSFELRERYWDDWGATAYIITRDYAERMINKYIHNGVYNLELDNDIQPLIENILFTNSGKSYTIPLFVEEVKFQSTFVGKDDDVKDGQKNNHYTARETVLNYWKNKEKMKTFTIEKVEKKEEPPQSFTMSQIEYLLTTYANDPENAENNLKVGAWYWNQKHTAPALSYFLRCAERAEDPNLAYEALLWSHLCYEMQGTRDLTARSLVQHAIYTLPNRPEAYYLLAKFHSKREQWTDTYIAATQGLTLAEKDLPPLRNDIGYVGEYALLYEKAVSGWWWGKSDEARGILQNIKNNYQINPNYYDLVINRIKEYGKEKIIEEQKQILEVLNQVNEFNYPENFNWSDLTYEDIITIEREVVHEKVYRFWKDVKEGDVVLDVGASVGAYTISILDQKPKKVYCVEPSKKLLKALVDNCFDKVLEYQENPLVYINCGVVDNEGDKINIFGGESTFNGITFKKIIEDYSLDHIDYMKIDCEGGEYSIFKEENMDFLLNKVDFIAMEVHLNYEGCREKFKNLRDKYLTRFKNYKVMSCTRQNISWGNSIDITDRIFDNQFIDEYTCEFMVYINRL
jgi:FkbM family methyltransferase